MKQMSLIEMDGFLKGKCIPRDLKVNETNAEYLVRKFGELESKLNEQREYYEGVISDGSKRIAELEAREIKPAKGEVLVVVSGFTGIVSPKFGENPEWRGLQQDKDHMI